MSSFSIKYSNKGGVIVIVFFDLDGTLISDDEAYIIPESAVKAIQRAQYNGHLMYVDTGRTVMNVEQRLRDIGFDGYICGCGTYIECRGQVIFQHKLPQALCDRVSELVYECNMTPMYEHSESFFTDRRCREFEGFSTLKRRFELQGKDLSADVSDSNFAFDKLLAWYDKNSDLERFKKGIEQEFDFIIRGEGFCELTVKGFSKGTGIKRVLEHYNIDISDAYAIGDSMNDLPMLNAVPNSIVMGESSDELKKAASFVTKNLLDDGIEHALKHFKMI